MDNLKTVNDTRGHDAGDKALQLLADGAAQPAAAQRRGLPDRRRRVRGGAAAGEPARRRARDEAAARRRSVERLRPAATRSRPASASRCSSRATIPSASWPAPTTRSTRPSAGAPRASPSRVCAIAQCARPRPVTLLARSQFDSPLFPANAYVIRQATIDDQPALERLAASRQPATAPGPAADRRDRRNPGGRRVSIADGRVVADPFKLTAQLVPVLMMRRRSLQAFAAQPSLTARVKAGMRPLRAPLRRAACSPSRTAAG